MSAVATLSPVAGRGRPRFTGAVRSELLKIGHQGLTWILVAGFALITALVYLVTVTSDASHRALNANATIFYYRELSGLEQAFSLGAGALLLIVSSRLVSLEYGTGTIRIVLARGTSRLGLLAAQYVALAIVALLLLAGFAVASVIFICALVAGWQGDLHSLTGLSATAWHDTWANVLAALVSEATCILLGTAAAVVGRSVAFGVGVALAFFPADNFGTIVMYLMFRITHQDVWLKATQWFLGPVLNELPSALQPDHQVGIAFAPTMVPVDAAHCWAVIGAFSALFLAVAAALTWRRDVLH